MKERYQMLLANDIDNGADDMQSTGAAIAMAGERSRQSKEDKGS